jgi:hypothetical protein
VSVPVGALGAKGEAEIGFQQVSELILFPGIQYVGPLPKDISTSRRSPAASTPPPSSQRRRARCSGSSSRRPRRRTSRRPAWNKAAHDG